jgi:hypothetical protein
MWRLRKNNLLVNEKDKLFVHKVHLERLLHAKTHIENKGPETPYFMKNKLSKKEINRVKEQKRCYENSIIFSRLLAINNAYSPYSKINKPLYCPAFDKKKHNFDKIERERNICKQNKFMFERLVNEKSFYPVQKILDMSDYENYLRGNLKKHFDNPNINFATFDRFKINILNNYRLKRCNSTKACNNSKNIRFDKNEENKAELAFSAGHNKSYNNLLMNNNINKKNNSSNSYNSTMLTSKMGKLSRCQSAFNVRNKRKIN